jgi:hypothetical protein
VVRQLDVESRRSPPRAGAPRRWLLAIATAGCTAAVLMTSKSAPPAVVVALILLATVGSVELSRREARDPGDTRPVAWTIGALFTVAVIRPPRFATDIWSYTMVGRILTAHHLNPYKVTPAALGPDPLLHLLHHTWRSGTTPYGPLFVLHSAFVALISGTHPLLYRLAFQLTAVTAIGIALWLIWRTTHSTAALALVGLNPAVAGSIVNGGHNDAMVALGLLGVVLLLMRGRTAAAGWVLCAAVLIKISIGFAVIPLAFWTATRYGKRGLLTLVAPTVLFAGTLTLVVPGALHSITNANGGVVTRLAIWNLPQRVSWLGLTHKTGDTFATAGTLAAVAVTVFAAVIGRRQPDPGRGAAVGAAAWLVAAGYVLAWYTVLGLLVAALRPTDRIARWIAVQGGVITAAFLIPRADLMTMPVLGHIVWFYVPLALTIGFVWAMIPLVADARREHRLAIAGRTSPIATE